METFIAIHPELWNEDIGEYSLLALSRPIRP